MDIVRPAAEPAGLDAAVTTPGGLVPGMTRPPGLKPHAPLFDADRHPGRQSGTPDPTSSFRYLEDSEWVFGPWSSHLSRWLAYETEGEFFLLVRFKRKGGGETRTYAYRFSSAAEVASIDTAMKRSPHPFGQVLNPRVIKAGVPFS